MGQALFNAWYNLYSIASSRVISGEIKIYMQILPLKKATFKLLFFFSLVFYYIYVFESLNKKLPLSFLLLMSALLAVLDITSRPVNLVSK